ncbi:MAG TPA: molybdate ABC transporter substrate-binding protein [Tepidisphaeraceae bacterium]|nr:molybdate ABC transporter substrate-binding protein [Tepidisphaeraceae bacterium]
MKPSVLLIGSVLALAALVAALAWLPTGGTGTPDRTAGTTRSSGAGAGGTGPKGGKPLLLYCAAGIRKPVEAAARAYEREYGVRVQLQFGGSQTLLANAKLTGTADLYVPADESYMDLARGEGLLAESAPVATMRPVLAVKRGNPRGIRSLDDLARETVRLGLADPKAAAIGKVVRETLGATGRWPAIEARVTVTKPTVNDVATDVQLGTIDAAFVWDVTVRQMGVDLETVAVPELADRVTTVGVGVLRSTSDPTAALHFLRYLSSADKGRPHFADAGFAAAPEADRWAESPRLTLYAGAMLRPAIDDTVTAFERREGVRVDRVYNGCGILVGQMKVGQRPDAYFACDQSFMTQVKDLFPSPADVSINQLVILVPKANPFGIKTLRDLAKPGLRLGVGHEKQCALGALTEKSLKQSGLYRNVRANVVVESPTGDLLVNQLLTKSLDAVVAYVSNATGHADELTALKIDLPCALATQPLAVSKDSAHRQLAGRLMANLRSAESRDRFEAWGFRWSAR